MLTAVEAGGELVGVVLGVPSMEAPPPALLMLAPLLDVFMAVNGDAVAAAGATAGAAEAAGEAAKTGAVALLLAGAEVLLAAFGDSVLKAVRRDRVSATPWEPS